MSLTSLVKLNPSAAKKQIAKLPSEFQKNLYLSYYAQVVDFQHELVYAEITRLMTGANYNRIVENIELIVEILTSNRSQAGLAVLFEYLLKKQPGNLKLIDFWIDHSVSSYNLGSLQKATFHKQRVTKDGHDAVVSGFNYYLAAALEKHRKLYGSLGLRLVGDSDAVYVKVKLLLLQEKYTEVVAILDEILASLDFALVDLDLKLIYINLLDRAADHTKLYSHTAALIESGLDDFNYWILWLKSGLALGKPLQIPALGRNALLLQIVRCVETALEADQSIADYIAVFGAKKFCIDDLVNFAVCLRPEHLAAFGEDYIALVNRQKLEYIVKDGDVGEEFIERSWKIIDKPHAKDDYNYGIDLVLLTVQVSLGRDCSLENVFKQYIILKHYDQQYPDHFSLEIWLIKLANHLGLYHSSLYYFNQLEVHNLQIDTLQYLVSTRMYIKDTIDLVKANNRALYHQMKYYSHYLTACYTNSTFDKIESYFNLLKRLSGSFERWFEQVELLERGALTGLDVLAVKDKPAVSDFPKTSLDRFLTLPELVPAKLPENTYFDNRDFKCQYASSPFKHTVQLEQQLSPVPNAEYIQLKALKLLLVEKINDQLVDQFVEIYASVTDSAVQFTAVEWAELSLYHALFTKKDLLAELDTFIEHLKESCAGFSHRFFNAVYVSQQVLNNFPKVYRALGNKNSKPVNGKLKQINTLVNYDSHDKKVSTHKILDDMRLNIEWEVLEKAVKKIVQEMKNEYAKLF